jgi:hypothetical protein
VEHEKSRLFCGMKRMSKWRIRNTTTSQAELKKEWKSWYCLLEIMTVWDASLIK